MGLAGYNLVWFVIHPASNVCFHFTWALQAILISFLTSFAVAGCFGLVFSPCFLTFPLFSYGLIMFFVLLLMVCPFVGLAGCNFPWFGLLFALLLMSVLFSRGPCGEFYRIYSLIRRIIFYEKICLIDQYLLKTQGASYNRVFSRNKM